MIHLSELGSSFILLLLVVGLGLMVPALLDRRRDLHRALLFGIAILLSLRYVHWRLTETLAPLEMSWDALASWSFFLLEALAVVSSLSAFTLLSRTRERSIEADRHRGWWQSAGAPRVAVLIATYNEELEVLERTVAGARALDYPNFAVMLLDDGRRDWLRDYAERVGVRHLTRPDNAHGKAGNINHALERLAEGPDQPDFVVVLDADFVPHRNFLERALALFHDPEVGLVQTPQHFFNPDPIQHNLGLSRTYPDEQRFFFDHLQSARDAWSIAFCCGTSSVVRWRALEAIGGFPTESVTEDFLLTLCLQNAGYRTVYLNEPLTEGLAPEGLKEYITQRARWCLGLMQIARGSMGPFADNRLRWRDRWSVLDSVFYWLTTFPFRLAALVYPLLYWFFNITVVDATVPDVVNYFGTYFFWIIMSLNFVSGGLVVPIINDVSQLLGARPISVAAFVGLIKPKGHPFRVTAKGGDRSQVVVQWAIMRPFLILFVLTLIGVLIGIFSDRFAYGDAGDGKLVILFWSLYNLFVLLVVMAVCIELPRYERHLKDIPERVRVTMDGRRLTVWLTDLTLDGARVRGMSASAATEVELDITGVGMVNATVTGVTGDGFEVAFAPTEAQREALLRKLYTEGDAPGVTRTRLAAVLTDITRRFAAARH